MSPTTKRIWDFENVLDENLVFNDTKSYVLIWDFETEVVTDCWRHSEQHNMLQHLTAVW